MEELTALRDQNSKLRKKVQHLEDEKDFQKDFSISSVTSISLQNSPEIVTRVTTAAASTGNDSNGQTPKLAKKKFFAYDKKVGKESTESLAGKT
jgi:predicted nuclease with TOPRIM domain